MLVEGAQLMLVGMGAVFLLLTVLVLTTAGMSRLVLRWSLVVDAGPPSPEELAAITAAVHQHRRRESLVETQGHANPR